jgi:hypothetical protein
VTIAKDEHELTKMKLWTYHSILFRLDDPDARIDPTQGPCWHLPRYREALPRLHKLLRTDQFLWCWTTRGIRASKGFPLVEWELDVPLSGVLGFHSIPVWNDIIEGKGEAWERLIVESAGANADATVGAWVRFPLKEGSVACLGQVNWVDQTEG